jgi:hypothetical protein
MPTPAQPSPSVRRQPPTLWRPDEKAVAWASLILVLVCMIAVANLGGEHFPRVVFACLAAGVGWAAGVSLARRRPGHVRLAWVAGGLMAAVAARWFLPTTEGVSLWEASRVAAQVEALPAGDVEGYTAGAARRQAAQRSFPEYAGEIGAAERDWTRRTIDQGMAEADGRLADDPARAAADLRALAMALGHQLPQNLPPELRAARRRAVLAWARVAQAELEALFARGEYAAVATAAARHQADLLPHARELDAGGEVAGLLDPVRERAVRARLAAAEKELKAACGRGEFTAVAEGGREAEAQLRGEAEAVGIAAEVRGRLLAVRRQAVRACLEAARGEVRALLEKDRLLAVADLGERLGGVLQEEAAAVGVAHELEEFRAGCRAFGELARQAGHPDKR